MKTDNLDWPPRFERTDPSDRGRNNNFDVSLAKAFDDLEAELERLGVDDHRYSFDAQQRKTDQRPYSRANPGDPGFVLRWSMGGDQYAVACDRFSRLRDNVRTVGLYVREKRKMEQRPVVTGESEFANARLPPGDDAVVATTGEPAPHEVLGIAPDAPDAVVRGAFRELVKDGHPDSGSGDVDVARLKRARDSMLD
jgi:hypothetical protein